MRKTLQFGLLSLLIFSLSGEVSAFSPAEASPRARMTSLNEGLPVTMGDLLPFSTLDEGWTLFELIAEKNYVAALAEMERKWERRTQVNQDALRLLQGILAAKAHRYEQALAYLEEINPYDSYLQPYVRLWLARTLMALNQPQEALGWVSFSESISGSLVENDLFWERIHALILLKEWKDAAELLTRRGKENGLSSLENAKILFHKGLVSWNQGDWENAQILWRKLFITEPGSSYDDDILHLLSQKPFTPLSDDEWLLRAENLVSKGLPQDAVAIYQRLEGKGYVLGREIADAYFAGRFYRDAFHHYEGLWNKTKAPAQKAALLDRLVNSAFRSNQFDKAAHYLKEKRKYFFGKSEESDTASRLAYIYFDSAEYKKAREAYNQLLTKPAPLIQQEKFLWHRAWSSYFLKDFTAALGDFVVLESRERSKLEKRKYFYWQARCLDQQNKKREAEILYRKVLADKPLDYYGLLATQRIKKKGLREKTVIDPDLLSSLSPAPRAGAIDFSQLSLPVSESLIRAMVLGQIGLSAYAYDETLRLNDESGGGFAPGQLTQSLLLAQNFTKLYIMGTNRKKDDFSVNTRILAYPQAYPVLVRFFSEKHGLDPFLAWSIMRQESVFKPFIVSPAQAIGLMQIIPQTGQEIADAIGISDFTPDDLKDPEVNIRFGTWYLSRSLRQFQGNMVYTIASYNAGPDAVNRWTHWGKNLPLDEFIELIPYKETNIYVKKVLHNYWMYQRLYGS